MENSTYYSRNKEKVLCYQKVYYSNNKIKKLLRNKQWRNKNKEICKAYDKKYRTENKEYIKLRRNKQRRNKRKINILYRYTNLQPLWCNENLAKRFITKQKELAFNIMGTF